MEGGRHSKDAALAEGDLLRILFVDPSPVQAGAQESLRTLLAALDRSRFEAHLAAASDLSDCVPPGRWTRFIAPPPRHPARAPGAAALYPAVAALSGIRLARMAAELRPAVIHANGRSAWLPARIAGWLTGRPLLWHARDLVGPVLPDQIAARFSDLTATPSVAVKLRLIGMTGAPGLNAAWRISDVSQWVRVQGRKIAVVPNGVDTARHQPLDRASARRRLMLPADKIIVGMVGQWAPWKRVDLFLAAAAIAHAENPRLYFVLWGRPAPGEDPDLQSHYTRALHAAGEARGWTENLPEVFNALDILAHPSGAEAFGRAAAEAMSCGTPVVAIRSGGAAEIVADGETGLLVGTEDSVGLAMRVLDLAADAPRRQVMGKRGRQRVLEHFSAEGHARGIERLYERLASD